jgi:hypothetical protein
MTNLRVSEETQVAALVAQVGSIITRPNALPLLHLTPPNEWWAARQEIVDIANRRIAKGIPFETVGGEEIFITCNYDKQQLEAIAAMLKRKSFSAIEVVIYHPAVVELATAVSAST